MSQVPPGCRGEHTAVTAAGTAVLLSEDAKAGRPKVLNRNRRSRDCRYGTTMRRPPSRRRFHAWTVLLDHLVGGRHESHFARDHYTGGRADAGLARLGGTARRLCRGECAVRAYGRAGESAQ